MTPDQHEYVDIRSFNCEKLKEYFPQQKRSMFPENIANYCLEQRQLCQTL